MPKKDTFHEMALHEQQRHWKLFIALSNLGFKRLDEAPIFNKAIEKYQLKFVIFEPITQTILEWKN